MITSKRYSQLEEITLSIGRDDMLKVLVAAGEVPSSFTYAESSIDGEWPLVMTFRRVAQTQEVIPPSASGEPRG